MKSPLYCLSGWHASHQVPSLLALLVLSLLALLGLARESPGSQLTCFTRKKSTNAGTVADLLLLLQRLTVNHLGPRHPSFLTQYLIYYFHSS